jgi:hypothetical protein
MTSAKKVIQEAAWVDNISAPPAKTAPQIKINPSATSVSTRANVCKNEGHAVAGITPVATFWRLICALRLTNQLINNECFLSPPKPYPPSASISPVTATSSVAVTSLRHVVGCEHRRGRAPVPSRSARLTSVIRGPPQGDGPYGFARRATASPKRDLPANQRPYKFCYRQRQPRPNAPERLKTFVRLRLRCHAGRRLRPWGPCLLVDRL